MGEDGGIIGGMGVPGEGDHQGGKTGEVGNGRLAVVVSGDRNAPPITWTTVVQNRLREIGPVAILIHGDAPGIDTIAKNVAAWLGVTVVRGFPADWVTHGRAAGPFRNRTMLTELLTLRDQGYRIRVEAFHDDFAGSKGTKDMVKQAARANTVPVSLTFSNGVTITGDDGDLEVSSTR
jgi:hypothetical protein